MQIITETELLQRIRAFLDRHAMAPTTFGRKATGNANLIKELDEGKSPSLRTVHKVTGFMDGVDAEALTQAKLHAEPPTSPPDDHEANQLPFGQAPVRPTGDLSPTCSPIAAPPTSSVANGSSRASTGHRSTGAPRPTSCSGVEG